MSKCLKDGIAGSDPTVQIMGTEIDYLQKLHLLYMKCINIGPPFMPLNQSQTSGQGTTSDLPSACEHLAGVQCFGAESYVDHLNFRVIM